MKSDKDKIIEKFLAVKGLGFVKSNRKNNTGIGKTFEDYVGVVENNLDEPDLFGYEIKSHRDDVNSYITLFTKVPNFPRKANSYLNSRFGTPYDDNPELKKSMFANKFNTCGGKYSFRMLNDRADEKLRIGVFDIHSRQLLDAEAGYTYECLRKVFKHKLRNLLYVTAERKYVNKDEYFYFNRAEVYSNPTFERFMDLLDGGQIMYDIRIGSYRSGKKYGKPHDHGSGFRILEANIKQLYADREVLS